MRPFQTLPIPLPSLLLAHASLHASKIQFSALSAYWSVYRILNFPTKLKGRRVSFFKETVAIPRLGSEIQKFRINFGFRETTYQTPPLRQNNNMYMGKTSFVSKETVVLLQLQGKIRTFQIDFGFWETAQPIPPLAQ